MKPCPCYSQSPCQVSTIFGILSCICIQEDGQIETTLDVGCVPTNSELNLVWNSELNLVWNFVDKEDLHISGKHAVGITK